MELVSACRLCHEHSDFVDAHVLPRAFYPERAKGDAPLVIVSSQMPNRTKKSWTGIYDQNLVCSRCENLFAPYDSYAADLLLNSPDEWLEVKKDGGLVAYYRPQFDYSKLKLFCLSLLWRAAASARPEFSKVEIGPHMSRLADLVRSGSAGLPDEFSCVISRFSDVESWQSGFHSPFRERYVGVSFYRFVAGMYVFYVKVDKQRVRSPFDELVIRPDEELKILARPFHGGPEYKSMRKMVRSDFK